MRTETGVTYRVNNHPDAGHLQGLTELKLTRTEVTHLERWINPLYLDRDVLATTSRSLEFESISAAGDVTIYHEGTACPVIT